MSYRTCSAIIHPRCEKHEKLNSRAETSIPPIAYTFHLAVHPLEQQDGRGQWPIELTRECGAAPYTSGGRHQIFCLPPLAGASGCAALAAADDGGKWRRRAGDAERDWGAWSADRDTAVLLNSRPRELSAAERAWVLEGTSRKKIRSMGVR